MNYIDPISDIKILPDYLPRTDMSLLSQDVLSDMTDFPCLSKCYSELRVFGNNYTSVFESCDQKTDEDQVTLSSQTSNKRKSKMMEKTESTDSQSTKDKETEDLNIDKFFTNIKDFQRTCKIQKLSDENVDFSNLKIKNIWKITKVNRKYKKQHIPS